MCEVTLRENIPGPKIHFTYDAISKIWKLVDLASLEVGWLGEVEQIDDFEYEVYEIHLLEQTVHAAETNLSEEGLVKFFFDDNNLEIVDKIRFWGHSHVNMGVSPSTTDLETISQLQENSFDYFIMGIFNKSRDIHLEIYEEQLILSDLDYEIHYPHTDVTYLEKEFEEKVKEIKPGLFGSKHTKLASTPYTYGDNYELKYDRNRPDEARRGIRSLPASRDKYRSDRLWGDWE